MSASFLNSQNILKDFSLRRNDRYGVRCLVYCSRMAKISASEVAATMVGDLVYFPVWWYSTGLGEAASFALRALRGYSRTLGLSVWVQNLFVPMYGQNDWQSRIISFFMRLVQIIGRVIILAVWSLMILSLLTLYVAAPVLLISLALYHLLGGLA